MCAPIAPAGQLAGGGCLDRSMSGWQPVQTAQQSQSLVYAQHSPIPHLHVSSRRTMARTMLPSITSVSPQMSLKGVPRAHSYTTCVLCQGFEFETGQKRFGMLVCRAPHSHTA